MQTHNHVQCSWVTCWLIFAQEHPNISVSLAGSHYSVPGLRERDLYVILSMCSELSTGSEPVTWGRMLHLARKPHQHLPMAVFSQLFRTLQRYSYVITNRIQAVDWKSIASSNQSVHWLIFMKALMLILLQSDWPVPLPSARRPSHIVQSWDQNGLRGPLSVKWYRQVQSSQLAGRWGNLVLYRSAYTH